MQGWPAHIANSRNVNGQLIDRMRKNVIKLLKVIGFAIDVETNL